MTIKRPQRIFDALAAHPEGLSTPQIAELGGEVITESRQQALTHYGSILRYYERKGLIRRAGLAPGGWQRGPAVIWRLMDAHRMIRALAAELPPEGERFSPAQRQAWVDAAAAIIDLVYGKADGEGSA
jgi:hypothetical protein